MMFLAGTAAVFKDETSVWMRPEVSHVVDDSSAIALAQQRLATVAMDATRTVRFADPLLLNYRPRVVPAMAGGAMVVAIVMGFR